MRRVLLLLLLSSALATAGFAQTANNDNVQNPSQLFGGLWGL